MLWSLDIPEVLIPILKHFVFIEEIGDMSLITELEATVS